MFTIKSLDNLKKEFLLYLKNRFNKLKLKKTIPSLYKKNFESYEKSLSYAGMETWLESHEEKLFFEEVEKHLSKLSSDSELLQFKDDLLFSLKNNFREEDYRFNIIENSELSKRDLRNNILSIIKELDSTLRTTNIEFVPNIKNNYFYKTNGRPSNLGLETKLKKVKIPNIPNNSHEPEA